MNRLIIYFIKNKVLVNIITLSIIVIGILASVRISREVFPNIGFDTIVVETFYPGGSAQTVEKLITTPLEQELQEVDGVREITSKSTESRSLIVLKLDPDQTTAKEGKDNVQSVVDAYKNLPDEVEDPIVTKQEFKNFPVIQVSLSNSGSLRKLEKEARILRREILSVPEVSKVQFIGLKQHEIRVEIINSLMKKFEVSFFQVMEALRNNHVNIPGGSFEDVNEKNESIIIRTISELNNVEDVSSTIIRSNTDGKTLRVRDVAKVTRTYKKSKLIQKTNSEQSIILQVLRKENADAIRLVNSMKKKVKKYELIKRKNTKIDYINDYSYFVKRRLRVLSSNLVIGLSLVLIFLYFLLPLRIALITAFGIPFSFFGVIIIFYYGGITLSLLSMMGLIVVIGMLVDDAIVVCENAQSYIEVGKDPTKAVILGTQRIWKPVLASVMTTVVAFAPIFFIPGVFGKFSKFIPLGVAIALAVSLFECFFILPSHISALVRADTPNSRTGFFVDLWNNYAVNFYFFILRKVLKRRYIFTSIICIFIIFSFYFISKNTSFRLFPSSTVNRFSIKIEAELGSSIKNMKNYIKPFESYLNNKPDKDILNYTTLLGQHGNRNRARIMQGENYAEITVYLVNQSDRRKSAQQIIATMKKNIKPPPEIKQVIYKMRRGGPPVGAAVSIGVRGDDYNQITKATKELKTIVAQQKGLTNIEDSFRDGKEEIHFELKEKEAASAGITIGDVGKAVRRRYEGVVAATIKELDYEVEVRVISENSMLDEKDDIANIIIKNPKGNLVKLSQVAQWKKVRGIASYEHENNLRQVMVTADLENKKGSSLEANRNIRKQIPTLEKNNPGIKFYFGGEDEDTNESLLSLVQSFTFALFGILIVLVMLFKNIHQPFLVATAIPLGITSVLWAFYFHGMPFSFFSSIGIIALSGVIVNNAIVFIDFVNKENEKRKGFRRSLLYAAKKRIRPIFLTTVTTAAGILPTAYGIGGLDPFVVPIAMSLGWGILGGSLLTIFVLPTLLLTVNDLKTWFIKRKSVNH